MEGGGHGDRTLERKKVSDIRGVEDRASRLMS